MAIVVTVHSIPTVVNVRHSTRRVAAGLPHPNASLSSCASQPLGLPLLAALIDRLLLRRSLGRRLLRFLAHCGALGGREAEELWIASTETPCDGKHLFI